MDGTTVSYPLALSLLSGNGGEHPLAAELRYSHAGSARGRGALRRRR